MRKRRTWIYNFKYGNIMDFGKKRLGNWVITKYSKDGVPHIKVSPVSGEFSWEYSSLDAMYMTLDSAMDDDSTHDGLHTCLGIMGGFLHASDPVFYHLYVKCMEVYSEAADLLKPKTSEEELEIIRSMKVEHELGEELKKVSDGEEGKAEAEV